MYNKRIKFIILSMRNLYLKIIIHRRNYMENKSKVREHGITLVALVITTIFSYDENVKSSNNKGFLLQTI